jgi:hypothetical protein
LQHRQGFCVKHRKPPPSLVKRKVNPKQVSVG